MQYVFVIFVVLAAPFIYGAERRTPEAGAELTYCGEVTAETTLKTFWQNARNKCGLDARKLVDLHEKASQKTEGKCGRLLRHHLGRTLIERTATMFTEALIAESFNAANNDIVYLAERLNAYDRQVSNSQHVRAIWRRVFEELDYFKETFVFLGQIFESFVPADVKVTALEIWSESGEHTGKNLEAFAAAHTQLRKTLKGNLPPRLVDRFQSLPEDLKRLYGSASNQLFGLRNVLHDEFLYAPRDNGPTPYLRTPLTWSKEKNTTDSDGHLRIELSATNASIAIGSFYGAALKFLYVDDKTNSVYFWIGDQAMANRWWSPLWHSEGSFSWRNVKTGQLLCATREYDENRRYVTLQDDDDNSCRWSLVTF